MVSDLTLAELELAPEAVRKVLKNVPKPLIEYVEFTQESGILAEKYLWEGVVSEKYQVDAQHIATATIHRADVLVSWNFKHINAV